MKGLLPVILAIIGLAVGTGAGIFLKPPATAQVGVGPINAENAPQKQEGSGESAKVSSSASKTPEPTKPAHSSEGNNAAENAGFEYVKLNNQFIIPVVSGGKVAALVVLSLNIEVTAGGKETVYDVEPKLRNAFLQVLFDHANSGGFNGEFTSDQKMSDLRGSLLEAAKKILGPVAVDVLVIDIMRQDVS